MPGGVIQRIAVYANEPSPRNKVLPRQFPVVKVYVAGGVAAREAPRECVRCAQSLVVYGGWDGSESNYRAAGRP